MYIRILPSEHGSIPYLSNPNIPKSYSQPNPVHDFVKAYVAAHAASSLSHKECPTEETS